VKCFGDVSENDHDKTSCPTSCSKEVTVFPLWNKTAEPESNADAGTKAIRGLSNVILIYAAFRRSRTRYALACKNWKGQLRLASLVRTENMSLVLDGLSHARVRGVVITAYFTEGLPAAFRATVGANRSTTVGALSHSRLAAWHSYVAVTGYVLDLTMHSLPPRKPVHNNASLRQVLCGIHARIIPRGLASESSYDS